MTAFHLVVTVTAVLQSFGLTRALKHLENVPVTLPAGILSIPVGQYPCRLSVAGQQLRQSRFFRVDVTSLYLSLKTCPCVSGVGRHLP